MPVNRVITLRPVPGVTTAEEVHPTSHWSTVTSPEGTLQAGDMTKAVKALAAPIDVSGVPWSMGGSPTPSPSYGLVRSNSTNNGQIAIMRVWLPPLRDDPNEYISRIKIRWYGSRGSGGGSQQAQELWLRTGDVLGEGYMADISAVPTSSPGYNEHVIDVPTGGGTEGRRVTDDKVMFLEWSQTNISGASNANGWNLYRAEVEFTMSLRRFLKSVG